MNKKIAIVAGAIATAGIMVGVYFGIRGAYETGVKNGREAALTEVAENTQALASTVAEKAEFSIKISSLMDEVSDELNAEAIDKYIANLENLIANTKSSEVRVMLGEYLNAWNDFKKTYTSEDNAAIQEAFNALRVTANDTAQRIKALYDDAILKAADKL